MQIIIIIGRAVRRSSYVVIVVVFVLLLVGRLWALTTDRPERGIYSITLEPSHRAGGLAKVQPNQVSFCPISSLIWSGRIVCVSICCEYICLLTSKLHIQPSLLLKTYSITRKPEIEYALGAGEQKRVDDDDVVVVVVVGLQVSLCEQRKERRKKLCN